MDFDKVEESIIPVVKNVLGFTTGIGVGKIVNGAVDIFVPEQSRATKIFVYIAKAGISSAISVAVDKNNNKSIDSIVNAVKKTVEEIEKTTAVEGSY